MTVGDYFIPIFTCLFSGSGLVFALTNSYVQAKKNRQLDYKKMCERLAKSENRIGEVEERTSAIEDCIKTIAKGVRIGLENDVVIFNALRTNHINGESERQEHKVNEFLAECTEQQLGG